MPEGKYIVIEGHDGTGKSTQVSLIRKKLKKIGIDSVEFHEPAGTPIADEIRNILKNGTLTRDAMTDLLLFSASRHEIWTNLALPALDKGKWVVAARSYWSTIAYQGYGSGLDIELIKHVTKLATDKRYVKPDIAVILDLPEKTEREKRIGKRGKLVNPDTYESRSDEFQESVRKGYLGFAKQNNIPIIDASQTPEKVASDIWMFIDPKGRNDY